MRALACAFVGAGLFVVACGDRTSPIGGELVAPEARQARVSLSPALDVSGLADASLGDRIVIDEVDIGVSDVRLLGPDPRIPTGGMKLIDSERVLASVLGEDAALHLPFPEYLLDDELAIYVRVNRSTHLDGASLVVRGRLFSQAIGPQLQGLTSAQEEDKPAAPNPDGEPARGGASADEDPAGAPNPDGEPAYGDGTKSAPNPDGEPARGGKAAPNPDGEPARPGEGEGSKRHGLVSNAPASRSVSFELRGDDEADLVVGFDRKSKMQVVLAVPAGRWLTPRVVDRLERELATPRESTRTLGQPTVTDRKAVVVVDRGDRDSGMRESMPAGDEEEAYRLLEGDGDASTTRR